MPDTVSVVTTTDPLARRLPDLLERLNQRAASLPCAVETVIVDDLGYWSTDAESVCAQLSGQYGNLAFRVVRHERAVGQPASMADGIALASGQAILTTDPDMAICIKALPEMLAALESGYHVVHGRRINRRDIGLIRRLGSRLANAVVGMLTRLPVSDIGSPVTLFTRTALESEALPSGISQPRLYYYARLRPVLTEVCLDCREIERSPSHYSLASLIRLFAVMLGQSLRVRRLVRAQSPTAASAKYCCKSARKESQSRRDSRR